VILKNRKVLGNLLPHRIRQGGQKKPAGPLIQEMTPPVLLSSREPQYRIRQEPAQADFPEYLLAEFLMKDLVCWRAYKFLQIAKLIKSTAKKDRHKLNYRKTVMVCDFMFCNITFF
jgi:hypothetical protein